jgi:extradiol dioxygenase family protein
MITRPGFHLAIPVDDLGRARTFYGGVLGLPEGRSSSSWVDWNFYGHQVVTHKVPPAPAGTASNPVDGHDVRFATSHSCSRSRPVGSRARTV